MVKRKETNNDKQTITQKTKDRATRYPLKTGGEPRWPGRVVIPPPQVAPIVLLLLQIR
jgi:hypothetical protein